MESDTVVASLSGATIMPQTHPDVPLSKEELRVLEFLGGATVQSRGAFIVLEGVDRSGKTTQSRLLMESLRAAGTSVAAHRFPARTTAIGGLLDAYLHQSRDAAVENHVIHLLFAADRWEHQAALRADLMAGKTVVCDRYAYSGAAYSAAKVLREPVDFINIFIRDLTWNGANRPIAANCGPILSYGSTCHQKQRHCDGDMASNATRTLYFNDSSLRNIPS